MKKEEEEDTYVRRNNITIVAFYPNNCSQFENPETPYLEKIASASSSFSTLSLPSSLPLLTSLIKALPLSLPQKITTCIASAFTSTSLVLLSLFCGQVTVKCIAYCTVHVTIQIHNCCN